MSQENKTYHIYMLGAISGGDGPKTKHLRARLGDLLTARHQRLLSPHVAYDYEQTTFRERVGGPQGIYPANLNFMNQADVFVGESSGTSEGRGLEIAYGLFVRQIPVLLFREESWGRGTNMIAGNTHPLLSFETYTPGSLEEKLDLALANIPKMKQAFKVWKKTHRGNRIWRP